MRAQTHAKMVKKIAMARQRSEEKRAAAEARKNREGISTCLARVSFISLTGGENIFDFCLNIFNAISISVG